MLLTAFGVFAYFPLLFLGKAFYGEEQAGFYYVLSWYVSESIQTGLPMTWISNYYGGVPASLDQFVSAWYPLNRLLFSLFEIFTAHHLSITIATIAGLYLSYCFGRAHAWRRSSSIVLALFYFSATTYAWIQIGTLAAHSFAILPGLLLALRYAYDKQRYVLPIAGGAVALGIGFLAGFMQIIFYDYVIAGLYALFLDWMRFSRVRPIYANFPISLSYAAITILGFGIGFLQLYPSASLIDITIRTDSYAIQNVVIPYPTELLAYILPPYLEVPFFGGGGAAGMYVTILGLLGCIFALSLYRTTSILFFTAVYAMFAGFAMHIPPFSWVNEYIPPFSHMGGNFRWTVGASFLIAFVGAAGIEGYLRDPARVSPRFQRIVLWSIGIMTGFLVIGSIILSVIAAYVADSPHAITSLIQWYTDGRTLVHPPSHYQTVLSAALTDLVRTFSISNPRYLFGVILWPLAGIMLAAVFRRWMTRRMASILILAYVILAVAGSTVLQWADLVPQALYDEKPAIVSLLEARENTHTPYRVMGYLVGEGMYLQLLNRYRPSAEDNTRMQLQTLVNNANLYFGIDRMDGMEPYRTLRHNRLLNTVIAHDWAAWAFDDVSPHLVSSRLDQLYNRDVQKNVSINEKLADFPNRLPLISMMNVKYLFSPFDLEHETLKPIATIPISTGTSTDITMYVYENTNVLPRIYAAHNVQFAHTDRDAFLATITEDDFTNMTIIECGSCTDTSSAPAEIDVERYGRGSIQFTVDVTADTWIVLSESSFPGWHASIDGTETPIYIANYLFQSIRVPKGSHRIHVEYRDIAIDAIRSQGGLR